MDNLLITPYLVVPFIAWLVAQLIKIFLKAIKGDADIKYLYASGGMPSSHSAVVCSLASYTLFQQGLMSPLFGVTAVLAGIVMYDSFGVRRSSGEQAKTINKLIDEMLNSGNIRKPGEYSKLREILGHQPLEVLAGAMLGVIIAVLFSIDKLSFFTNWLTTLPTDFALLAIFISAGIMVIASLFGYLLSRHKFRKKNKLKSAALIFLSVNLILGALLLIYSLVAKERIVPYGQIWMGISLYIVWLILILWSIIGLFRAKIELRHKATALNSPRRADWLRKAKSKKRK